MNMKNDEPNPPLSRKTKIKWIFGNLLRFFFLQLWSKKQRYGNTIRQSFLDCFSPLYWKH